MTEQTADVSSGDAGAVQLSHRQIMAIISGLLLGMFLAALDQTIVSTSIRTIADDLHGYSMQAWVTTAYLITSTIVTPLYGKLSDIYGRKPFYLFAIAVFVVGSFLCSFANSMTELAIFRAIQGIGAGGLMSLALTIVGVIVAPRDRAKYQAYFMAVFGTSAVLGPVLGGVLSGADSILAISGWRWVFLVNVPLGIIALGVVFRNLNVPHVRREGVRIDWFGALALVVALVPLLVVAEQGREWGWGAGSSVLCYVIGGAGVIGFIAIERHMGEDAILPLRIFRNRSFAIGVIISFVVGAVMFGGITMLPQYFQVVQDASPTKSGFLMLPMVAGLMLASLTAGRAISRTGHYRIFPVVGSVLLVVGLYLLHTLTADSSLLPAMAFALILGLGLGSMMSPLTLAMQNILPAADMGVSTAAATFFRQIGGTLGVAIFLTVMFSNLTPNISAELSDAAKQPAFSQAVEQAAAGPAGPARDLAVGLASGDTAKTGAVMDDTSVLAQLPDEIAHPFKAGFAESISSVFLIVSGISVIALVLVLFWKEVPLRNGAGTPPAKEDDRSTAEPV